MNNIDNMSLFAMNEGLPAQAMTAIKNLASGAGSKLSAVGSKVANSNAGIVAKQIAKNPGTELKAAGTLAKNAVANNPLYSVGMAAGTGLVAGSKIQQYKDNKLAAQPQQQVVQASADISDESLFAVDEWGSDTKDYPSKESQLRAKNRYKALKDEDDQNRDNARAYKWAGRATRAASLGAGVSAVGNLFSGNYKKAAIKGAVAAGTHVASNLLRKKARDERYKIK